MAWATPFSIWYNLVQNDGGDQNCQDKDQATRQDRQAEGDKGRLEDQGVPADRVRHLAQHPLLTACQAGRTVRKEERGKKKKRPPMEPLCL